MKNFILIVAIVLGSAMYKVAFAQVNVRVNIGNQPVWGPVGYDYAEYYYFPDHEIYYNIPKRQFIYFDKGRWISTSKLKGRYKKINLINSYKVVINTPHPYLNHNHCRTQYSGFRGRQQPIIYNSQDPRYFIINDHPYHNQNGRNIQFNELGNQDYGQNNYGNNNQSQHNTGNNNNYGNHKIKGRENDDHLKNNKKWKKDKFRNDDSRIARRN